MKTMSNILNAFTVSKFKEKTSLYTDHCLDYVNYMNVLQLIVYVLR